MRGSPAARRRRIGATAAVAVAAAAGATALGTQAAPTHRASGGDMPAWSENPRSADGPSHWTQIGYSKCLGTKQSPIDIVPGKASVAKNSPLRISAHESELAVENTGHVVEVPIPEKAHDTLRLGGTSYHLEQYHFHEPSEHTINGKTAPLEGHFVFKDAKGGVAVVGVLYRVGSKPNKTLDKLLTAAPEKAHEETHAGESNPLELMHGIRGVKVKGSAARVGSFYGYRGSLTTPDCSQGVVWSVLVNGGHVSSKAVAHVHDVVKHFPTGSGYENNARPTQPLDGRKVTLHRDTH